MFGFFEIVIIAVIAFLVLGPEEFPKATRKFLRLINSFKESFTDLKTEMSEVKQETEDTFLKVKQEINTAVQKPIKETTQNVKEKFVRATEEANAFSKATDLPKNKGGDNNE